MCMNLRKIPLIFLILSFLNLITIITVPYTISPNTVSGIDGNPSIIDSYDLWEDLNPYAALIYTFGDFNCHQIESRSFFLNDNQMPVCARCTGLAFSFILGSLLFVFAIPNSDPFLMALTPFLREKAFTLKKKKAIVYLLIMTLIFATPIAIDGLFQLITSYESTNAIRLVTGLLFGWMVVLGIGVYLESAVFRHIYMEDSID